MESLFCLCYCFHLQWDSVNFFFRRCCFWTPSSKKLLLTYRRWEPSCYWCLRTGDVASPVPTTQPGQSLESVWRGKGTWLVIWASEWEQRYSTQSIGTATLPPCHSLLGFPGPLRHSLCTPEQEAKGRHSGAGCLSRWSSHPRAHSWNCKWTSQSLHMSIVWGTISPQASPDFCSLEAFIRTKRHVRSQAKCLITPNLQRGTLRFKIRK